MNRPWVTGLAQTKVFRPLLLWRILSAVWLGLALLLGGGYIAQLAQAAQQHIPITLVMIYVQCLIGSVFSLFIVVGTLNFWRMSTKRFVVTPTGIEYHNLGYSIQILWRDLDRIWSHWFESLGYWYWPSLPEKLLARRSQLRAGKGVTRLLRWSGSDRVIPVGEFAWDWRYSELGELIQHYAPFLNVQPEVGQAS